MECIILAGGLGTRLRGVIGEQPKCMAPVNGQPFLHYLLKYLEKQGCTKLILSLGYKHEVVTEWITNQNLPFEVDWVIEHEPLGTGGGIKLALQAAQEEDVFILNGDTFFDVNLDIMYYWYLREGSEATLALKKMSDFERYGTVKMNKNAAVTGHTILSFEEKKPMPEGLINGGVYLVDRVGFLARNFPDKFSFEKEYLEALVTEHIFTGFESDAYFIDIGVPEDYEKVQQDFKELF